MSNNPKKMAETEYVKLKVLGQDNIVVQFKIKRHTPLRRLMRVYCDRLLLSMKLTRFTFDGRVIRANDTPALLGMVDGDTIEVYQQQAGGGLQSKLYHEDSFVII